MANTADRVLAKVCSFADDYRMAGMSPRRLFAESGYAAHRGIVTEDAIYDYVRTRPELVGSWYAYSENKRTDRGWHFFISTEDSNSTVEYHEGARVAVREQYVDRAKACAAYIKREFDELT